MWAQTKQTLYHVYVLISFSLCLFENNWSDGDERHYDAPHQEHHQQRQQQEHVSVALLQQGQLRPEDVVP